MLQALRAERCTKSLPVLVLSARGTEMDKLVGFERGADDYLTKPFSPKELVARVGAILRRTRGEELRRRRRSAHSGSTASGTRCSSTDGRSGSTPTEFRLLEYLVQRQGRVFSREQLLDKVWGLGYFGETRTVDVTSPGSDPSSGSDAKLIRTVTGVGYSAEIPKS